MAKVRLWAFREFKPMRDEIEYTFYLKNQAGEKRRYEISIPSEFFATKNVKIWETLDDDDFTLEIDNIPWDDPEAIKRGDFNNPYHETFYHMLPPLDTWQETALRYYRDHPRYPDSDDMTDEELLAKVLEDDPWREAHWINCWESEHTEKRQERYERYLRLLEEFPEDFDVSLESFNKKRFIRGEYVGDVSNG